MKKLLLALATIVGLSTAATAQTNIYFESFEGTLSGWGANTEFNKFTWQQTSDAPVSNYTNASGGSYIQSIPGLNNQEAKTIVLNSNISTVGFKNIKVSWGEIRTLGNLPVTFAFSTNNGKTFTTVNNWSNQSNSTNTWALANNGTAIALPAAAENTNNLVLSWAVATPGSSPHYYGIDDLIITGEAVSGTTTFSFNSRPTGEEPAKASANGAYTTDGVNIRMTQSSSRGVTIQRAAISSDLYQSPARTFTLAQTNATNTRSTTVTTSFSNAVENLSILFFDVDRTAGRSQDILVVEGFLNGQAVRLSKNNVVTTSYNTFAGNNTIQGATTGTNAPDNSPEGNVTVTFPSAVNEVRITYRNGDAAAGNQGIAIAGFSWTKSLQTMAPLPVELSSFSGSITGKGAQLNWTTASEKDNDRFIVERSQDGTTFEAIGEVKGQGNSKSTSQYTFTDKAPKPGFNYYRLQQVDFDGKNEYSGLVALKNNAIASFEMSVYPNPASANLNISFGNAEPLQVNILNMNGAVVKQLQTTNGTLSISVEDLPNGIYLIKAEGAGNATTGKFVKN